MLSGLDGSSALIGSAAEPLVGALEQATPIATQGLTASALVGKAFQGPVARFNAATDADPSTFSATIDWGDGTASKPEAVTITALGGGEFQITGSHVYGGPGRYNTRATVADKDGGSGVAFGLISADALTGRLAPFSDTGGSSTDNITNLNQPTFEGTTSPLAVVQVFAQQSQPPLVTMLGQTIAGPDGRWSLMTGPLHDGSYTILASTLPPLGTTDPAGTSTAGFPSPRVSILSSPLIIDTNAPRVTTMDFNPRTGSITVVFQDAISGLDTATLADPSNYILNPPRTHRGRFLPPALAPSISGFYTDALASTVVVASSRPIPRGRYLFKVDSGGIRDLAGNPLDGEFLGTFPTGDGRPGGHFLARLTAARSHFPRAWPRLRP